MAKENMLQRALRRMTSSNAELESEDLQRSVRQEGSVPIQTCEDRQRVQLTGTVSTVTINPRAGRPALEVERLNRAFCALPVTRDVNLTLDRGARRALIGPNGAGKTTLVNLITGALKPHSGRVLLNGEDITALRQADRARRGLARTFQINQLFRGLTVLENL